MGGIVATLRDPVSKPPSSHTIFVRETAVVVHLATSNMNEIDLRQLLDRANEAEKVERNYEHAQQLYKTVLAHTPLPSETPTFHEIHLQARERLASLLSLMGQQKEALAQLETYQTEAHTRAEKTKALALIGQLLTTMGRLSEALQKQQEALLLATDLDTASQALAHLGMGNVLYQSGRLEEALASFEKALPGFVQAGDQEQQLRVRNWQGMAYARLGQTDKSIKAFQEGLRLARQIGERAASVLLNNLGEAYQNLFDMEQALIYHEEGMQLAESTQLASNMADLARNLGVDLVYLGRMEEGIAYLYRALSISEETGQVVMKLQTLYSLALAEAQQGNWTMAQTHAQVLLELAQEKKARAYEADALHALGVCYKEQGAIAQAEQAWQQASFLAHETEQRMLLWQIHAELAEAAMDDGLADVHRRIAAEVIEQIVYPIADKKLREKFLNAPAVKAVMAANAE
ncbi:MAG: tetratricopeptide repeat protein [Anaerolineales bacterium]|nr:tetratricopeptide repeat protein [Anaerolineales bacterium]